MFKIGLFNLTNFINIIDKNNVDLSTLIKYSNGCFIFNVYLNMVLILIKGVHSNVLQFVFWNLMVQWIYILFNCD
jgi:hypothetical protein